MDSCTQEKFLAAVEIVKNLPKSGPIKPSNDVKLKFYSYYKQATEGPCELPKPGFWDIVNRAKWDAWSKLQNMSKEDAMKSYVEEFVEIMKETIPRDPDSMSDFYSVMGPYLNLVPEEIRAKHGLVNGNSTKFLNNNTLENVETCNTPQNGKPMKHYEEDDINDSPEGLFAPLLVNGHNMNGNDSDSDEFSDTLEQVNESESDEHNITASVSLEENADSSAISSTKGSIVNVRGGGDQKLIEGGTSSPAAGSAGARGNRSSRQVRSIDNPLQYLANNNNIGGAGGSRRSGGNVQYDIAADANEQLALAVIRLQHIMEQVVVRLDTLETLLTQRQPVIKEVSTKKSSWSFGVSPRAAIFFLAWPFIVQWLMFLYKRRNRRT